MPLLFAIGTAHIFSGLIVAKLYFKPKNRTELLLIGSLLSFVTFYMIPIALGWATGYMNGWIIAAGLGSAVTSAVFAGYKQRKTGGLFTTSASALFRGRFWLEWVIIACGGVLLLLLLTAGSVLPVRYADAPSYHMSNPMSWHRTGRFILESFGEKELSEQATSSECAPNVKAILPFLVLLITKDTPGTALAQFPFLLILVVAVRALSLRIGARNWVASLAAVATIAIPEVFLQSIEAYSDLMFLSGQAVVAWSLVYLWQEKVTWRSLFYPAVGFGILAGAKSAFIATGGVLGMFYGILLIVKCFPLYGKKTPIKIGVALLFTIVSILSTGAPWFYHAWQKFNNPVYPIKVRLGDTVIFDGRFESTINSEMLESYTGVTGGEAYWNTLRETSRSPILSSWSGGLGAAMFICGIPALGLFILLSLWTGAGVDARRILVVSGILLTIACPTLAIARFSLYQPVIALVALAWLLTIFPVIFRAVGSMLLCVIIFYDISMSTASILYRARPAEVVAFNLLSGYSRGALLDTHPAQYTALDFWREEVSKPGLTLGLPPYGIGVWQSYAPWSPANILRYRHPTGNEDASTWYTELSNHNVTHLYLQKHNPGFQVALSNPKYFRLLVRRLDSQYGRFQPYFVQPWPEDALFELVREVQ